MPNQVAVVLFLMILAGFAVDAVYYDLQNSLFLSRKFLDLIEWLAFWR